MTSFRSIAKRTSLGFAAALVTLFYPGITYAEVTGDTTTTSTAQTTGPEQPTGADGNTFTFNSTTGVWENDYYTWDPVTKQTTPKNPAYTYDPITDKWNTDSWVYDAPSQKYVKVEVPAPNDSVATNDPQNQSTATSNLDYNTATAVANGVSSTAISGDATVAYNTLAGDAQTGDATILSNTINLLQSSFNLGPSGSFGTTFTADINDHVGDLVLDPSLFVVQPAAGCCSPNGTDTDINIQNDGQIYNNIMLDAASGDATVTSNTAAGDASTGSANAVANIMNLANSAIAAAGSFMGVINIYGDLNGDILLPPEVMAKILAGNAPTVTLDTSNIENSSLLANINNNQSIANNVTTNAASGAASVSNNTSAGSATTGNSSTNITLLNLTGHQVVGANSLLVFVNVLGQWVGLILDAPNGTSSALLGDQNASYGLLASDTTLNSTNNLGIVNDVNVAATSGNATVAGNTSAGNALSGNATASANLLNMANSSMSLTGWLGVLFINVFGGWNGSFGVDTAAGNPTGRGGDGPAATPQSGSSASTDPVKVFQLAATTTGSYRLSAVDAGTPTEEVASTASDAADNTKPEVLATTTTQDGGLSAWQVAGLVALAGCCLALFQRMRASRSQNS